MDERCGDDRWILFTGPEDAVDKSGGVSVNDKFFSLPEDKQKRIINAGFRVFSQNSYKKSPVSEIAAEAGISKSLLFHYFRNKKELYLFLWEEAARITTEYLREYGCYEQDSLFDMLHSGTKAKMQIMRSYPDIALFVIKAYYEKDEEISTDIQRSYRDFLEQKAQASMLRIDPEEFDPGIDLKMMYQEMYWASEGYLFEVMRRGVIDIDQLEKDFEKLIDFWKETYGRKGK